MTEFLVLVVVWAGFLLLVSRKGMKHLLAPHVGVTMPVVGGISGALLEALPTQALSPGFTMRTAIAVLAGVFAGRLCGKLAKLWAMGHERRSAGNPAAKPPRLVHPMIALGMFLAGVPVIWHVLSSNHSYIEERRTPRDDKTEVALGFEEISLPADGPNAALLLHDLYASPADFGDLPAQLHERGFAVAAPLLPGHGHFPDDLDLVWAESYHRAARAAFDALAAKHTRVVVIGNSFGGTLAVQLASERPVAALVLVNPFIGRLVTPSWCPISYDSLLRPMSRAIRRRIYAGDGVSKVYFTQSLHAAREAQDLATTLDVSAAKVKCPTLVIVGAHDDVVPPDAGVSWASEALHAESVLLTNAGHAPFLGQDGPSAIDAVLRLVAK